MTVRAYRSIGEATAAAMQHNIDNAVIRWWEHPEQEGGEQ